MPKGSSAQRSFKLFFSYSHRDETLRDELAKHLTVLRRQGVIKEWHDRRISAGQEWKGAIDKELNDADVILLLVSSDFVASDYCFDVELKRAIERHHSGEARVIAVILRPVAWDGLPFAKLQFLPKDGNPITKWPNQDEAFESVTRGIQTALAELQIGDLVGQFENARRNDRDDTAIQAGMSILSLDPEHSVREQVAEMCASRVRELWIEVYAAHEAQREEFTVLHQPLISRPQYTHMLTYCDRAVQLCPDRADYHAARAQLHAQASKPYGFSKAFEPFDYRQALADYARAIELAPTAGKYFYERAELNDPAVSLRRLEFFAIGEPPPSDEQKARRLQAQCDFERAIELGYIDGNTGLPRRP